MGGQKGVNVSGVIVDLDVVTESDRVKLELAARKDGNFVAASFVRDAEDLYEVNTVLEEFGAEIPIIARIERAGAVENLDEIIDTAYGVIVSWDDLGVECPMEEVPIAQKRIIRKCREDGQPVITATEMLDSICGIVAAQQGITSYPSLVTREVDIPIISNASIDDIGEEPIVTLDAERGCVRR